MSQLLPVIMRIMTLMAVLRIIYEGSGEMSDSERDTYADVVVVLRFMLKKDSRLVDIQVWWREVNSSCSRTL